MQLPTLDPTNNESLARLLENMSRKTGEIQQEVLEEILRKNANTEYLSGFLDGYTDKEVFKNKVPLVEYEDILPYIERIANGESHEIISAEPITELFLSSGTSGGKHKWIPRTAEALSHTAFFIKLSDSIIKQNIDGLHQGKRMFFRFVLPGIPTPGGLVAMNAGSSLLRNNTMKNVFSNPHTSPHEVILCPDLKQSMYSQLLCGLVLRDSVVRVGTDFATAFLRVIKFLEEHWQELCSNIRTGNISNWIADPNCRQAVSSILCKPMPSLADLIEKECEKKSWKGIIKKLWPGTKSIEVIITGSMAQYIPKLEFYSGGVPLVTSRYATSEGFFGVNLKPLTDPYKVTFTLIPWMAYYEFLPLDDHISEEHRRDNKDHQKSCSSEPNCMNKKEDHLNGGVMDLANVKLGQHYELVVTTFSGLYRYRVGDVLMVTDFQNNAPEFKFVQRRNVILSIDIEKTTEEDLFIAVSKAMHILKPLGFLLTDYTSYADQSSFPGHYVLFWELQMEGNDGVPVLDTVKMEQCCNLVEESLDMMYKTLRRGNVIDHLEIRVVKQGTFDALMDLFLSEGRSFTQYKPPKGIKSDKAIRLLNSMVVGGFSSKVLPTV